MSSEKKTNEAINKLQSDAAKLEDEEYKKEKINSILSAINEYSTNLTLATVWDNILAMVELIKNPDKVNTTDLALCIAALAYVINPIDVIPDVIPIIGYTDDAAVVCWVIKKLDDVLEPFRIKVQRRKENLEKKKNAKKFNEAEKKTKRKRKHHEIEDEIDTKNETKPLNKKRKSSKKDEDEHESDNDEDDDLKSLKHINLKEAKGDDDCIVM